MASVPLAAARQLVADRLAEGDPDGALDLAQRIAARFPGERRSAILTGRAHLAQGDAEAAGQTLDQAVAAFPDDREAWAALAASGADGASAIAADLPPLPPGDGQRPSISAAALGHLYLRQLLLTHCTAQLEPLWRADGSRRDVGVALAEAHWRLGETTAAEAVCRILLEGSPECLKANLILAQILWAAGRKDEASPLVAAAEAVDPENELAEDLYEWLAVRDPALVPLRRREITLDVAEAAPAQAALAQTAAAAPLPPAIEDLLGIEGGLEPIPEAPPFWEKPDLDGAAQLEEQDLAPEGEHPAPEAPAEVAATEPELAETTQFENQEVTPELEEAIAAETAAPEPTDGAQLEAQEVPPERELAELGTPTPESGPRTPDSGLPPEPEIAETAPEPALAVIEAEAEHAHAPALRWLEVSGRGQPAEVGPPSSQADARAAAWSESCRHMGVRLGLGALRASSIEGQQGAVQLLHDAHAPTTVAVAPPGANLGLLRAALRRASHSTEEQTAS